MSWQQQYQESEIRCFERVNIRSHKSNVVLSFYCKPYSIYIYKSYKYFSTFSIYITHSIKVYDFSLNYFTT